MIKRPRPQLGQMPFELPTIRDNSKPSVLLHKNGRYLLFKPQSPLAAAIMTDLVARMKDVPEMRQGRYWRLDVDGNTVTVKDWKKIEIWQHLEGDVSKHPLCQILQSQGVEVGVSPTLAGYIAKEWRHHEIERVGYPVPAVTGTSTLFERCSVGTNLRCIKNYVDPTYPDLNDAVFTVGKHYMVVSASGNGTDSLKISRNTLINMASIKDDENAFEWNEFNSPMEEYFDDSEDVDLGPTVAEAFPKEVAAMRKRLDALGFELFEHVAIDSAMEALKRSSVNGKLMRMGKTSEAITVSTLWGSKKIAVLGSTNVLMAWQKEFARLGVTDYIVVDSFEDLKKPARYYLMRYGWIRKEQDSTHKLRKDKANYLRAGERSYQVKIPYSSKKSNAKYSILGHHPCPHCDTDMVRPLHKKDVTGKTYKVEWTPHYGYMCRNQNCAWTTDNRKKKGAAWNQKGNELVHHKPGSYIDWGLAAHANCSHDRIPGRKCLECGEVDGVWVPQPSKRLKKFFSGIIVDEIHNMKDHTSQTHQAITRMRSRRKYGATGTLVSNGPMDPYWIFHWLFRGSSLMFPYFQGKGAEQFESRFCDHVMLEKPAGIDEETGEVLKKTVNKKLPFLKNPADWWRFISPLFLRRNYSDPLYEKSLLDAGMFKPDINIQKLVCPMTPDQIKLMLSAMKDFKDVYEKHKLEAESKNKEVNKAFVISQMSTMCTIATVPEAINQKLGITAYEGANGGGKMYNITTLAKNRIMGGGKVLILSDFIAMQKGIEAELKESGIGVIRFNTSWGLDKRREAFEQFAEDPTIGAMVAGTRAVSEAVDASVADTCICVDLLWAPAFQQQAWSRILQATKRQRTCDIFMVLSENSIDEHKYDTFYAKLVASEQSQDRKVVNRRAMTVDIKWFAERVIEEEANLSMQIRDLGFSIDDFAMPAMNMETSIMERMI